MSRTQNSVQNLKIALTGQFFGVLISFVARMVFLYYLNEEYLGLEGLFSNILSIFSLAELGIGTAINYSLYKPLADKDKERIKSLMFLYRRFYILVGCVISLLGLLFTPCYSVFMANTPDIPYLTVIYWLFVADTAVSYFFSYKQALIICDEKRYIVTIYHYTCYFLLNASQIILLMLTRDYILFLVLKVLFTLVENIGLAWKADRMYPYLREKDVKPTPEKMAAEIRKNIKAMLFHRIGAMAVLSTDNLILSRYVGIVSVGLYSNYCLITTALDKIINQVFNSIGASVGNLGSSLLAEDRNRLENVFNRIFFANFWICGVCSCCLMVLFNPFISLWLGKKLLLDEHVVLVIVINFYLHGMRKTTNAFRIETGAFYYDRYKPIAEIIVNIVASIWLVKRIGMAGVFLGTIVSTLLICIWTEAYVLHKYVFHKGVGSYMFRFVKYTACTVIINIICVCIAGEIVMSNLYIALFAKLTVCLSISNTIILLCFFHTGEFKYYMDMIKTGLKGKMGK